MFLKIKIKNYKSQKKACVAFGVCESEKANH